MPEKKPTRTADLDYFYGQSSELFSFYRIPKLLFQDSRFQPLSTDAKALYGILLDRMSLSARNGWLDKAGRVFIIYTVQEVQDSLGCADKKATKLLRELEEYGLIERKRRGLGKPDLIYVKNFSSESSKLRFLNRDIDDSGVVQNTLQDPAKLRCNGFICPISSVRCWMLSVLTTASSGTGASSGTSGISSNGSSRCLRSISYARLLLQLTR